MADIIVGTQIVRRIIRLKMQHNQIIQIRRRKSRLVRIYIICILFTDDFHALIQKTGMHHVVMIEKTDEISRCHRKTYICIAGDTQIFLDLLIADPAVFLLILQADPAHVAVLLIASVSQAQFPVSVGLRLHGIDHLPQEFLRRIIERNQNADL